jgi:hypothetical protein
MLKLSKIQINLYRSPIRAFSSISPEAFSNNQHLDRDPEAAEAERQSIIKQKKILRKYLRLKRNNFYERNDSNLTDGWY